MTGDVAVAEASTTALQPAAWAKCIGELPSLPSAFIAAVQVLSRDDAPASSCIDAIERDQALTVRILRLANSVFYGAPGHVSRIADAVQMLGLRTVASTLAAMSLRSTLGSLRCEGFSFDSYWRHTLCTALASREIARTVSLDPGEAFLLGLLHDVGKLILAMTSPELEAQAMHVSRSKGISSEAAEVLVLGVSHAEVGAAVARQWNFPGSIAEAIGHHHEPLLLSPGGHLKQSQLVHLANHMAHSLEASPEITAHLLNDPMWSVLGIHTEQLRQLMERVSSELCVMALA